MSNIEIRKVNSRRELRQFVQFYYDLYSGNDNAVPYIFFDEMDTLRSDKNPSFECCEAEYFMAFRDGKMVGRTAAIINHRANEQWGKKEVRFGWTDFIDDQEVSAALLKAVEEWGREKGMNQMAGPMGFIDTDREGMLVEGFDELSTMYVNYNYPYYPKHMEQLGLKKSCDWVEFKVRVPDANEPTKYNKIAELVKKRYNLRVHKFTRRELVYGGYGHEVFRLLNETYKDLYNFSQLSEKQIDQLVNYYIKLADMNLVTAIMDGDRMVGFGITFPSFSRALQKTRNGKLFPMGWWHLLKILKFHRTDTVDLLLIGVLPEYRSIGANTLIFDDLIKQFQRYGFKWAEVMPHMETNTNAIAQWQHLDSRQHRRHRCYTKQIE